jgi:hypothetical protein
VSDDVVDEDPTPVATPAPFTIRERMADLARAFRDKTAHDPEYLHLIAPFESPARQIQMGEESGCALAILGFWRLLGIEHELLARKYVESKAVEWMFQIARDFKAIHVAPFSPSSIKVGDACAVDGFTSNVHVFTPVAVQPAGADAVAILSIDGGQRESDRTECIRLVKRHVVFFKGAATDHREDPMPQLVRPLTHRIDLEQLAKNAGLAA